MATRGRQGRDDGQKEFTGRVRRWTRVWAAAREPKVKELKFQRWMRTDERLPELAGPRHAYIVPYKDPDAKPYPTHMVAPAMASAAPAAGAGGAAGGIKRGKSQASLAPPPPQPVVPPPAVQPQKIRLKFKPNPVSPPAAAAGGAAAAAASPALGAASPPAVQGQAAPPAAADAGLPASGVAVKVEPQLQPPAAPPPALHGAVTPMQLDPPPPS